MALIFTVKTFAILEVMAGFEPAFAVLQTAASRPRAQAMRISSVSHAIA